MRRREPDNQPAFGSDSFLDIVANAVGILVILIVLVGLRASRVSLDALPQEALTRLFSGKAAVQGLRSAGRETDPGGWQEQKLAGGENGRRKKDIASSHTQPASDRPTASEREAAAKERQVAADETPLVSSKCRSDQAGTADEGQTAAEEEGPGGREHREPERSGPSRSIASQSEFGGQLESLARQTEALQKQLVEAKGRRDELRQAAAQITSQLVQLDHDLQRAEKVAQTSGQRLARVSADVELLRRRAAELEEQVRRLEQAPRPVQKIEHRVTPISHEVKGPEIHFRLAGGRVSVIPLEELLELVKKDVERRRSWLLKFRKHRARVGPIDGYVLEYVVERTPVSTLEQLEAGRRIVRVSVTRWQLQATEEVIEEDAATALRPGSRFWTVLLVAPSDATFTFWVYPDSFALFRKLQRAAQERGFTVAARPLPFGVPIAGSPFGTRSLAQ